MPDATTFVVFRDRIQPIRTRLFERLDQQLRKVGFEVHRSIAVDATLVEAYTRSTKNDDDEGGSSWGDSHTSWRGFPVLKQVAEDDYEVIAASVGMGFVSGVSICRARKHETHHPKEFVWRGTRRVNAEMACVGNQFCPRHEAIIDRILAKASQAISLTRQEQEQNARNVRKGQLWRLYSGIGSSGIDGRRRGSWGW